MDQTSSFSHANISTSESDDNELPTYDELAARDPSSRFGRWKGWIEKRAAERYADDTPESRLARQLKGWGPQSNYETQDDPPQVIAVPATAVLHRTQTRLSSSAHIEAQPVTHVTHCETLSPSHLKLYTFGSRFIPHSEYPILSLLPISNEKRLLIGHSSGLCVLDMDPEVSDMNIKEPRRYDIFYGEGIYQMDVLELEETSVSSTPKGIVLTLVGMGSEGGNGRESRDCPKSIRMYNLASLANLAQWACDTKGKEPLDLTQCGSAPYVDFEARKRRSRSKVASVDLTGLPVQSMSSPLAFSKSPVRESTTLDKDVNDIRGLPMHWATEYASLATPGSRLDNQFILFYTLQRCKERGRVTARLAVATKQSILLYETVRGERSFRFVKEFYTPAVPRSITFVQQRPLFPHGTSVQEDSARGLTTSLLSWLRSSQINNTPPYGQLSLFVTFDKKACLIRILDSSVIELQMGEAKQSRRALSLSLAPGGPGSFRLSRSSLDGTSPKESRGTWLPPFEISLTSFGKMSTMADILTVYLLTRGKCTYIVPAPLIIPLNIYAPLKVLEWGILPTSLVGRLCQRPLTGEPFLQVTALGPDGLEIQEFSLYSLDPSNLKGKQPESSVIVQADVGPGGAGFLRVGGHWNKQNQEKALPPLPLHRHSSKSTLDTSDLHEKRTGEQGFYAWAQKGFGDWRVFWLGGDADDGPPPSPSTP